MIVTDTNSKGRVVLKNRRGTYISVEEDEIQEAINCLERVKMHRELNLPREQLDSRKY